MALGTASVNLRTGVVAALRSSLDSVVVSCCAPFIHKSLWNKQEDHQQLSRPLFWASQGALTIRLSQSN